MIRYNVICFQSHEGSFVIIHSPGVGRLLPDYRSKGKIPDDVLDIYTILQYTKLMMLQKSSRHYHYTYSKTTGIILINTDLIGDYRQNFINTRTVVHIENENKKCCNTFIHGEGGLMHTDSVY